MENDAIDFSKYFGKYVVIRTLHAGVHIGTLENYDSETNHAVMAYSRRIWVWEGAFTLSELSQDGIRDGKISIEVPEIIISNVEEIILCSSKAEGIFKSMKAYVIKNDKKE